MFVCSPMTRRSRLRDRSYWNDEFINGQMHLVHAHSYAHHGRGHQTPFMPQQQPVPQRQPPPPLSQAPVLMEVSHFNP